MEKTYLNETEGFVDDGRPADDPTDGLGILISFDQDEDFLKIKETLTRMGVSSRKENTLYQSCHILHKRGKFYILHFKELFILDGKYSDFSDSDKARRNTITRLLEEWDLLKICDPNKETKMGTFLPMNQLKILPFREKENWTLAENYSVGNKPKY